MKCAWCGQTAPNEMPWCGLCGRPSSTVPMPEVVPAPPPPVRSAGGLLRRNLIFGVTAALILLVVIVVVVNFVKGAGPTPGVTQTFPAGVQMCSENVAVIGDATCEFAGSIQTAYHAAVPAGETPSDPVQLNEVADPVRQEPFTVVCQQGPGYVSCPLSDSAAVYFR